MTPQHSNKWNTTIVISGFLVFLGTFHLCQGIQADCGHLDRDGGLWKVIYPSKQPSYTFLRYDCQYNLNVSPDYDGWCLAAKYALTVGLKLYQGGKMIHKFSNWNRGQKCFNGSMILKVDGYSALLSTPSTSRYKAQLRYGQYKNITVDEDCPSGAFRCRDSKMCIPSSLYCDGSRHCLDSSDDDTLAACPTTTTIRTTTTERRCSGSYKKCPDGRCIFTFNQCDHHRSCNHRSARCSDGYHCYSRCDGIDDCPDGSDERDCETETEEEGHSAFFAIIVMVPVMACMALVCRACNRKNRSTERSQASTAAATPLQPVPTATPYTHQPESTAATAMMPSVGAPPNYNDPPPSYDFASRYPAPKDVTIPSYENAVYHPSPVYVGKNTASPHPGGATGVPGYEGATYHPAPAIGGAQANPQPAPYPTYHPPPVSSPYGSLVPPTGVAPSPLVHAPPPSGVEAPPPPFTGNAPPMMPPPPMGATAPPPPPGGSVGTDSIPTLPPPSYNQAVQQDNISSTV